MRFENVSIAGLAHVDGPHRVTSAELEDRLTPTIERLGLRSGVLEELAGIKARHWFDDGTQPSDIAAMAARKVLAQTGVGTDQIGIVVNTSVCRDYLEPSTACIVHGKLGLAPACINFDVGNACLGFLNGMEIVGNMIERGIIDYGLVVDGEDSRHVINTTIDRLNGPDTTKESFRSQFATLTLGGGGAAMLLTRSDLVEGGGRRFMGGVTLAATEHRDLCWGHNDRMFTDTRGLLFAGVQLAAQTLAAAVETMNWDVTALDQLVLHQVSRVHTETLCNQLGLDSERAFVIYDEFGNVGPAAVPIVFSKAVEAGRITTGDRIALMGIGSGLNCAMAEVIW